LQSSHKKINRSIVNIVLIISIIFLSGCDSRKQIKKFKKDYGSSPCFFHSKKSTLSFIRGSLPNKTSLTIIDTHSGKETRYRFANYCFEGPHELIPDNNKAIASAFYVKDGVGQLKILVLDLDKKTILHTLLMPSNCSVVLIKKPNWSKKVFILFRMRYEKKTMLKAFDLLDGTVSDTDILGNYDIKSGLFMEELPYLILDVSENDKNTLRVYDLSLKKTVHVFEAITNYTEIKESYGNIFYGILQIPGNSSGKVLEYDLNKMSERCVIELDGELESIQKTDGYMYVTSKDLKRSNMQNKYWLYPRNLYMIDMEKRDVVNTIDWTQRKGEFVGYDKIRNEIFYSVIDNDDPSLWIITSSKEILVKVKNIIK